MELVDKCVKIYAGVDGGSMQQFEQRTRKQLRVVGATVSITASHYSYALV